MVKKGRLLVHPEGRRTVGHNERNGCLPLMGRENILLLIRLKVSAGMMHVNASGNRLRITTLLCIASMLGSSSVAAIKNMAVVVSAGSKLSDIPLADLVKLCKGTQKAWPDGKSFTLVIKNPESPEMRVAVQKLFGDAGGDLKAAIAKLNESRVAVKIAGSDEELLHTVESTPGAVGILDVYSINSSVKVLRVDGKLPFDIGYALKGN
jgi:hypothetical protein